MSRMRFFLLILVAVLVSAHGRPKAPVAAHELKVQKFPVVIPAEAYSTLPDARAARARAVPFEGIYLKGSSDGTSLTLQLAIEHRVPHSSNRSLVLGNFAVSESELRFLSLAQTVAQPVARPQVKNFGVAENGRKFVEIAMADFRGAFRTELDQKFQQQDPRLIFSNAAPITEGEYFIVESALGTSGSRMNILSLYRFPHVSREGGGMQALERIPFIDLAQMQWPESKMPALLMFPDKQTLGFLMEGVSGSEISEGTLGEFWIVRLPGTLVQSPLWGYVAVAVVLVVGFGLGFLGLRYGVRQSQMGDRSLSGAGVLCLW